MLLHSGNLLKWEAKRIYHEYNFVRINAITLVKFNANDEEDEENKETGSGENANDWISDTYFEYSRTERIAGTFNLSNALWLVQ